MISLSKRYFMHKKFLATGAVLGGLAVLIGAYGAHGLERMTSDPKTLRGFETGAEYQMYHSIALLLAGILFERFANKWIRLAGKFFIAGIILFSGSLYVLSFLRHLDSTAVRFVGPITPLGGLCFIVGWMFLLAGVTRKDTTEVNSKL